MQRLHKLAEIGMFTLKALYPREISVSQAPQQSFQLPSLYKVSLTRDEFLYHILFIEHILFLSILTYTI
jgi:hypothetical protein